MDNYPAELYEKSEIDIIRPVLKSLPRETQMYFLKIFENEKTEEFFDVICNLFSRLKVKKLNFITNIKNQLIGGRNGI